MKISIKTNFEKWSAVIGEKIKKLKRDEKASKPKSIYFWEDSFKESFLARKSYISFAHK